MKEVKEQVEIHVYTKSYILSRGLSHYEIIFKNPEDYKKVENYINLVYEMFGDSLTNSILFYELKRKFEIVEIKKVYNINSKD